MLLRIQKRALDLSTWAESLVGGWFAGGRAEELQLSFKLATG